MPRTAFKVDLSRPPEAAEIKTHKTGRSRELMKPKISLRTTDRESRYASVASSAIIEDSHRRCRNIAATASGTSDSTAMDVISRLEAAPAIGCYRRGYRRLPAISSPPAALIAGRHCGARPSTVTL
jgi:hypothetical protein